MMAWPGRILPTLAITGMLGTALASLLAAHDTLAAWLAAAIATSAVPIGALAVLLMSYLVRGQWTNELHVPLAAASLNVPVAGLLFLPVLAGIPWLYPWAQSPPVGAFKSGYLVPWFFALRSVLYFAIWSAVALWAHRVWGGPDRMR